MTNGTAAPGTGNADFLDRWHEDQTGSGVVHIFQKEDAFNAAGGVYETVSLRNFTFLGQTFKANQYVGRDGGPGGAIVAGTAHSGAGVCNEMRTLLIAAQKDIFAAYAAEVTAAGKPISEGGFISWCGVQQVNGWQFRKGQHARGSAIDIDPALNPYVATRTNGIFGGEEYLDSALPHNNAKIDAIRKRAIVAYQRAWGLRFDTTRVFNVSGLRGDDTSETVAQAYDRFFDLHNTLVAYFDLRFHGSTPLNLPLGQQRAERERSSEDPGSFSKMADAYRGGFLPHIPRGSAALDQLYHDIAADYDALRLVMVNNSLVDTGVQPGFANSHLSFGASRDPARGLLRIGKPIVTILRDHLPRWGAIDFGAQSNGDIMHFDRDRSATVATGSDPNPDRIFYAKS